MAFSSILGSADAVLGTSFVLGADVDEAPNVTQFFPPLVVRNGHLEQLPEGDRLVIAGFTVPPAPLAENVDIYVDVLGSDANGDGSPGNPYRTIFRAAEHYIQLVPGNNTITVRLSEGIHELEETFTTVYPFGANLFFEGETEAFTNPAISNIDSSQSTDTDFAGIQYFDFDLELTGATNVQPGFFVKLAGGANGTDPQAINGLHEIIAWDEKTEIATCRAWQLLNVDEIPAGAVTVTGAILYKTVLNWTTDVAAMNITGTYMMGHWNGMVWRGNKDTYASQRRAVQLFGGAVFRTSPVTAGHGLGFHEWGVAVDMIGSFFYSLANLGISKMRGSSMQALFGSTLRATGVSINGTAGLAINGASNSELSVTSARIHSVGGSSKITIGTGTFLDFTSSHLHFEAAGSTGLNANTFGRILATGATIAGITTPTATATQGAIQGP